MELGTKYEIPVNKVVADRGMPCNILNRRRIDRFGACLRKSVRKAGKVSQQGRERLYQHE